jgi:hypothetical protein
VFANLARRTSPAAASQDRKAAAVVNKGMEPARPRQRGTFPEDWGPPPANAAAVGGWIQDNLVKGIRRARAGERVAWLGPQLRSAGSPRARLLELEQRERIHGINLRRLQLLQLRAAPPWQV